MAQLSTANVKKSKNSGGYRLSQRFGLIGQHHSVVYAGIICVVLLALFGTIRTLGMPESFHILRTDASPEELSADALSEGGMSNSDTPIEAEEETSIVIHVDGAVSTPGVYRLSGIAIRMVDAVDAAGGLKDDADTTHINLAATLDDGMKVYIPFQGEVDPEGSINSEGILESSTSAPTNSPSSSSSGKININTASAAELETLPGIGEATAAAIIDERTRGGAFSSVDDLQRVNGIGEKRLAKIRDYVCV